MNKKAFMILKVVGTVCGLIGLAGDAIGIFIKDDELRDTVAKEVEKQLKERS